MRTCESDNHAAIDAEHARVLSLLRDARDRPLSVAALHEAGVRNPATIVYELEVRGYVIRHVAAPRSGAGGLAGFRLEGVAAGVGAGLHAEAGRR